MMVHNTLTLLSIPLSLISVSLAGSVTKGQPCTQTHNRLQIGSYQFTSDCDSVTYCAANGTCLLKGCRRDIFPFGYPQDDAHLPPICPQGQFCPDEEDACQTILPVGSPCQLNRDDQCEPPPNWKDISSNKFGQNHNGSVCLNFKCMWANVTAGSPCVVENTPYIAYGPNNQEFIDIVSRGNCVPGLYCDSQQLKCMQSKNVGESCDADKECQSFNCLPSQVCGEPADAPKHFAIWVYIIVGIGIFGGMFGTLFGMYAVHRRQRDLEREKRIQYWQEQNSFRQNIMQLREAARASYLELPSPGGMSTVTSISQRSTLYSREGAVYEESQPILKNAASPPKSRLRNNKNSIPEDGNEELDEPQRRRKHSTGQPF